MAINPAQIIGIESTDDPADDPADGARTFANFSAPPDSEPETVRILQNFGLFQQLAPAQLEQVAQAVQHVKFPARTNILAAGQQGEAVYFLRSGTVKVWLPQPEGNEVILNICGPGEVLGEISIIEGCGHTANVMALEDCELLWIGRSEFVRFYEEMPALSRRLAVVMAHRLRCAVMRTQQMARLTVPGRLACQLLSFAADHGEVQEDGSIRIRLRLSQQELADLLGVTRASISSALRGFQQQGVLSKATGQRIVIHDRAALEALCE